jgi:hypothetical protein
MYVQIAGVKISTSCDQLTLISPNTSYLKKHINGLHTMEFTTSNGKGL